MLDVLFGWRKASKCKALIGCVRCRLKLLRNKRESIVRQLCDDIAQLLSKDQFPSAFARAEQLFKDQSLLTAYDLLDQFCEFITVHLPYMRRNRDLPNDINEAVSSLIFASARCADLPELQILRKLFANRYGNDFAEASVEVLPRSLVNRQIREKLCIKEVSDDIKLRLIEEIADEYKPQLGHPDLENECKPQNQQVHALFQKSECNSEVEVLDKATRDAYTDINGATMRASNANEMLPPYQKNNSGHFKTLHGEATSCYLPSNSQKTEANLYHPDGNSDIIGNSFRDPTIRRCSPDIIEPLDSPLDARTAQDIENLRTSNPLPESTIFSKRSVVYDDQGQCAPRRPTASMGHRIETITEETASESSTQFLERFVVYLDDEDDIPLRIQEDKQEKHGNGSMLKSKGCLQGGNFRMSQEKDYVAASGTPQSEMETDIDPLWEGKSRKHHGKTFQSPARVSRVSLSDVHHYDSSENHTDLGELQGKTLSSKHSVQKKSTGQRLKKRSMSKRSRPYNSYSDNYDFGDFRRTNRSQSRGLYNWQHQSPIPVVFRMKETESVSYYDDTSDSSDIDSPPRPRKMYDRHRTKQNGELSSRGNSRHSLSNLNATGRMIHPRKWKHEMPGRGSATSSFRCHDKKSQLRRNSCCAFKTPLAISSSPNRCEYNRRRMYSSSCGWNRYRVHECCLEHPCYFLASENEDEMVSPSSKWTCGTAVAGLSDHCHCSPNEKAFNCTTARGHVTCISPATAKPVNNRGEHEQIDPCRHVHSRRHKFRGPNTKVENEAEEKEASHQRSESTCSTGIPLPPPRPPYLRAMTMPLERPKVTPMMNPASRSVSLQVQMKNPEHIHPKLPDYDDLAAKFTALKKEHWQSGNAP